MTIANISDQSGNIIKKVAYAKSKLSENNSLLKKIKKQAKLSSLTTNVVSATKQNAYNGSQQGSSVLNNGNLQQTNQNVNKKSGIDHSLDLSTDTENAEVEAEFEGTEDRGWDLPEALQDQLLADLESSFVEEDSDDDIYVDGEPKRFTTVSLKARKGVKTKSILDLKGKDLRDAIQDWFRKYEEGFDRTAYLDPKTVEKEDFGDGTISGHVTFIGKWDNAKNWLGNATVYLHDSNSGVNIALPVAVIEMNNGRYSLFARLQGDVDVGNQRGDHVE